MLTEISGDPNAEPDLKIFIEPKEQSGIGGNAFAQGFVSVSEAEAYKREIQTTREHADAQVQAAQANAKEQIEKFRSEYATKFQFDYHFESKGSGQPFLVSAIYGDDGFTHIKCAASEKPAIYEVKDSKPKVLTLKEPSAQSFPLIFKSLLAEMARPQ